MAEAKAEKPFDDFKVPLLITSKDSSDGNHIESETSEVVPENINSNENQDSDSKNIKSKKAKKLIDVPLPYKEPSWSGIPPDLYSLEIIKNGTFLEVFKLKNSLIVFGRLDVCDIVFEHPSVSRYHAIIQYCQGDSTHAQGFYLYDLGSTHGTFLNKDKITPKIYYKLKVGYILKFGGSTRLHVFQGPEEEEVVEKPKSSKIEEEICSWGISEDAEEEEDLTENPFALSTPNEELYLDDPKKTLRGWFEREGYELEYDVEEKGFKTFSCRIQLPIDTPTGDFMSVEASVSGKKKEAVIACALEACRTLDRLGLLRQSHQESRQHKKKKWEENDYYDSDEDTFLDRTGTIEKKREMRKRTEKKPVAETFESIEGKLKVLTSEMDEITKKLSTGKSEIQGDKNAEDDSLEAYMSTLSDSKDRASDKIERRKLKFRLMQVEKEKRHLEKLLEIVRPTKLPPTVKYPGMIGKRIKSKLPKILPKSQETVPVVKLNENEEEVEEDSDLETDSSSKVTDSTSDAVTRKSTVSQSSGKSETSGAIVSHSSSLQTVKNTISSTDVVETSDSFAGESSVSLLVKDNDDDSEKPKAYGLILNIASKDSKCTGSDIAKAATSIPILEKTIKESNEKDISFKTKEEESSMPKKRKRGNKKHAEPSSDVYMTESAEYSTWVPPAEQSGDGMTHLNSKYGY